MPTAADQIRRASGIAALNPVVVALALGILLRATITLPGRMKPGIAFSVRPLLRAAIVLLGLQITLRQLIDIGPGALVLAVVVVFTTLAATIALGRWLKVEPVLASLIGTGTAICGASAIVAANQVVRGRDEDVVYALAVITLCGTAAMMLDPTLTQVLALDARQYGLWTGTSIHEVIQAVGAAAAGGAVATEVGPSPSSPASRCWRPRFLRWGCLRAGPPARSAPAGSAYRCRGSPSASSCARSSRAQGSCPSPCSTRAVS